MNCKPGDLAIVVKMPRLAPACFKQLIGRIVRVVVYRRALANRPSFTEYVWQLEEQIPIGRFIVLGLDDDILRPLRDNDGIDETLTWKELENV